MPYIKVWVDEVPIEEIDDETVADEYFRRYPNARYDLDDAELNLLLERLYHLYRSRGDCPDDLREIFWKRIGRSL